VNRIPRRAVDGVVRHPLTGAVEFTTTDQGLAEKVAATLDEHSPVTPTWFYETLFAMPSAQRGDAEWVMSSATWVVIHVLASPAGSSLSVPPFPPGDSPYLLGQPIVLDEDATGVSLRVREAATR
jgi:HK97 family phage major capsid protein